MLNLNELKAERIRRGYSAEGLAQKMGHQKDWIYRRENGQAVLGAYEFIEICHAMGCTEDETFSLFARLSHNWDKKGEDDLIHQ